MTIERAMVLMAIISVVIGLVGGSMVHATREPVTAGRHRITRAPGPSSFTLGLQVIACWLMSALPRPYVMKGI